MNPPVQPFTHEQDEEISLTELVMRLWQRRAWLLGVTLGFCAVAVLWVLLTSVRSALPVTLYVELNNIQDGLYPNESAFSPQELVNPQLLAPLQKRFGFEDGTSLREALSVAYGSPLVEGVKQKYAAALSRKGLNTGDYDNINTAYAEALRTAAQRGLRITVDSEALNTSVATAKALALAIPQSWNEALAKNHRVLLGTGISTLQSPASSPELRSTVGIFEARQTVTQMKAGLTAIAEDNRVQHLLSAGNYSASDLLAELSRFEAIRFSPIVTSAFGLEDTFSRNVLAETQLSIDETERNIAALDQTLALIERATGQSSGRQEIRGNERSSSPTVQLASDTLSQVLDMSQQAALSEYTEEVLRERQRHSEARSKALSDLERSKSEAFDIDPEFLAKAESLLQGFTEDYRSLLTNAKQHLRTSYGNFYTPLGEPTVEGSGWPARAPLIIALAFVLGLMLSIMAALIIPQKEA